MSFTLAATENNTNGTTAVTVVASPSSGFQTLVPENGITVYNLDTAAAVVVLQKLKGATVYIVEKISVPVGKSFVNGSRIVLDDTDESIQVVLEGAVTTNELKINAAYGTYGSA